MTKSLYDTIAEHDEAITKEAVVGAALRLGGALLRGAGGLGKAVVTRPMTAIGAALTTSDVAGGAKRFSNITATNRANPYRTPTP